MEMSKEENILKYNPGEKSLKVSFFTYTDMESLHDKIDTCHNNPEYSSTSKTDEYPAFVYSLFGLLLSNILAIQILLPFY